ncbi:MAG: hypothetical protein M1823_004285 [Watsoniomyces obsoletus]|nr:MAG: hypothetical protein M1823_004285 [Watsoniomyces obsoletus]
MPDPIHAHFRRGAAFTFDSLSLLSLVQILREPLSTSTPTIYAPSFDHALKDPVANDIAIEPTSRIIIFEGNYLSLDQYPWNEIAGLMDELWFVEVDFDVARKRLVKRHLETGVEKDERDAVKRVEGNDLLNGREILEGMVEGVHEIVRSREDDDWK